MLWLSIYETATEAIENKDNRPYGKQYGFTSKEECQKYCDILNKENLE